MLEASELVRLVLVSTSPTASSDVISECDISVLGMRDVIGQSQLEACVGVAAVGDTSGLCAELFPPAFHGSGTQMMSPFCVELRPALS